MAGEERFVPNRSVMQPEWGNRGPSRQLTAVGVEGPLGASYTVYETNWTCSECKAENYPSRKRCYRCRAPKPADTATRIVNGRANPWREVLDPQSMQLYYHNTETNETRWDRPEEMGPAPHATGWFGRGAAGSKAAEKYDLMNEEFLKRPARKQVDQVQSRGSVLEGANEYNIWYNKYIGDHWNNKRGRDPAETRCVIAKDAGFTKGDKAGKPGKYFCLYFCRGACAYGYQCHFAHRLPVKQDMLRLVQDEIHDCFGRQRHKDHRDDMDGVGCIMKPCRTLFVGSLQKQSYKDPQELEAALWQHFGEFGEVENVNLIARLSIGFIRFRNRASAEFAKEAMANQPLDHGEVLNIRWAYDDPNPVAVEAAKRADVDAVVNMMQARGVAIGPGGFSDASAYPGGGEVSSLRPDDYHQPAPKRLRLDGTEAGPLSSQEAAEMDKQYQDAGIVWYPNTDAQYEQAAQHHQASSSALEYPGATAAAAAAAAAECK